jgi:hypothetical protein
MSLKSSNLWDPIKVVLRYLTRTNFYLSTVNEYISVLIPIFFGSSGFKLTALYVLVESTRNIKKNFLNLSKKDHPIYEPKLNFKIISFLILDIKVFLVFTSLFFGSSGA